MAVRYSAVSMMEIFWFFQILHLDTHILGNISPGLGLNTPRVGQSTSLTASPAQGIGNLGSTLWTCRTRHAGAEICCASVDSRHRRARGSRQRDGTTGAEYTREGTVEIARTM